MNKVQRAILFLDVEPVGAVQGVGMLVHAGIDLLLEEFNDFIQDSWGNGEVLVCPWNMLNDWCRDSLLYGKQQATTRA